MVGPPYLDPAQIDDNLARSVLNFLNAARTPEEVANAIEFLGEPDIGVRLGERLLKARDALGGFTDIRQVRAIRLIGPERFTEIVTALSARPPAADPLEELRAELAALRNRITGAASALSQRRLMLRMAEPNAYLGQAVSVMATLTDGGRPAVDVPVTFVVTRGQLRASDGYDTYQGHLITARTGIDGVVRLAALTNPTEELNALQQDALSGMLVRIDPNADTPAAVAAALQEVAEQYAWEVNAPLRQAIDIYVREFRPMLLDTVDLRENLLTWSYYDSALLAFAPVLGNGDDASSVSATATLHLRVRNWIPAFLEAFVARTREQSGLVNELRTISRIPQDGARTINDIYAHAANYVGTRRGMVGAYVGRKVAESSIRVLMNNELADLPADTRSAILPALGNAARTLATTDAPVLQALVGTRREISETVDRKTSVLSDVSGVALGRLDALENAVAMLPDDQDLGTLRTDMLGSIAAAKTELGNSIQLAETNLTASMDAFKLSYDATLTQLQTDFNTAKLKLDSTVTQTDLTAALASKVDTTTFNVFQGDVTTQLGNVRSNLTAVDTRITNIGVLRQP
ncbi:MAG TPA: hypothetical protein VF021_00300 [Longimicrobiales bacterium]